MTSPCGPTKGAPLDLRAVQADLRAWPNWYDEGPDVAARALAVDVDQLLAHCRALRAVLGEALTLSPSHSLFFPNAHAIHQRAVAVLAQATDD